MNTSIHKNQSDIRQHWSKIHNSRILIINPNIDENNFFKSTLQKLNFSIVSCVSLKSGLLEIVPKKTDLILVDETLLNNEIKGFVENVNNVSQDKNIPIILITNDTDQWTSERLFYSGIIDTTKKPLDSNDFLIRIEINLLLGV